MRALHAKHILPNRELLPWSMISPLAEPVRLNPSTREAAMDYRIILVTFGAVFVMELGDKTQIATFVLAGKHGAPASQYTKHVQPEKPTSVCTTIGCRRPMIPI